MGTVGSVSAFYSPDLFQTYACNDGVLYYYLGAQFGGRIMVARDHHANANRAVCRLHFVRSIGGGASEVVFGTDQGVFFTTTDPTNFAAANALPFGRNVNAISYLSSSGTLLVGSGYGR